MRTDSFECYLKPRGAGNATSKFREIPSNLGAHSSHYAESIIQKYSGDFTVVVKFNDNFVMPPDCSLLVEISMKDLSAAGKSGTYQNLLSRSASMRGGKVISQGLPRKDGKLLRFTTAGFKNAECATNISPCKIEAQAGTVTVDITFVQRLFTDGHQTSIYGPRGPGLKRYFESNSLKPLGGDAGRSQVFVFRPLAKAACKKVATKYTHAMTALGPDFSGFTEDATFEAFQLHRETLRKEIRARWETEQAERQTQSSSIENLGVSPLMAHASEPRSVWLASLTADIPPLAPIISSPLADMESKQLEDDSQLAQPLPAAVKARKRRQPATCSCPDEHCPSGPVPKLKTRAIHLSPVIAKRPTGSSHPRQIQENRQAPKSEQTKGAEEITIKACNQCKRIKPAPRGKKIAYRKARGSFMYVPQSAPDDDDVEDQEQRDLSYGIDRDDDEPLLSQSRDKLQMAEMTQTASATHGGLKLAVLDEDTVPTGAGDQSGRVTEAASAGGDVITPFLRTSELAASNTTDESQTSGEAIETEIQTTTPMQISTPQKDTEAATTKPNSGSIGESQAALDVSASKNYVAPPEQFAATEEATRDVPDDLPKIDGPINAFPVAGGTGSKKRSSEAAAEQRSTKKRQIHVDLTIDEDDDMIAVKREMVGDQSRDLPKVSNGSRRKADLEARLEDNRLQQTEVRLKREAAEMLWQLKQITEAEAAVGGRGVKIEID